MIITYGIPARTNGIMATIGPKNIRMRDIKSETTYGRHLRLCVTEFTISHTKPVSPL
jgi:hypothetical protein